VKGEGKRIGKKNEMKMQNDMGHNYYIIIDGTDRTYYLIVVRYGRNKGLRYGV